MNENPETPSEGMEEARAEAPQPEGTPTVNIGGSGSVPPYPTQPPPDQYSSGGSGTTDLGSGTPSMTPPPSYPQGPPPQQAPPQSAYTPPPGQGQPTQYMPPPQYNQPQGYPQQQPPAYPPAYPPGQQGPVSYGNVQPKDPMIGLLLELIGYVGFLGIGHIWAGKTTRGIALLVGWWVYLTLSGLLTIVLIGCVMLIAWPIVPIASGLYLKNEMEKEQAAMGIRR